MTGQAEHEGHLREQEARGAEAAQILNSRMLKDFFEGLRAECVAHWRNTQIDAASAREDAWRMDKAIALLEQKLKTAVANGDYARKQLLAQTGEKEK